MEINASDESAYLLKRETEEREAAEQAACMARTAHLDLADMYAERRIEVEAG